VAERGRKCAFLRHGKQRKERHALREDFLGIAADELGRELLLRLSQDSLNDYELEGFDDSEFVPTAAWRDACSALRSEAPLGLIVGRPGAGKSVIARKLLHDQIAQGEAGLWIPGDALQNAASLSDAVCSVLKHFNPNFDDAAGHVAVSLATSEHPLLLVLDDANRTDAASRIPSKVLGWGRNLFAADEGRADARIKLIVPIWESHWSSLHWRHEGGQWLRVQTIGPMLREESIACLRNGLATVGSTDADHELDRFADRLRDDPILLSTFARLVRREPNTPVEPILDDAIGCFVADSSQTSVSSRG
jgi:hypothetical protein